jgi:hypothetical protein
MKTGKRNLSICSRCIYDERVPAITFDDDGVCNYCAQLESLKQAYGTGQPEGKKTIERIFDKIKKV